MKKLYFGSNLKMYKGIEDTKAYLKDLHRYTKDLHNEIEMFIIPSYLSLEGAVKCLEDDAIRIGAQNMCFEDEGQFTGEVSYKMLEEVSVKFVMIGHSERRHTFLEDDYVENKKVLKALEKGFKTLLCIGETLEDKNFGLTNASLERQLKIGLNGVKDIKNLWIAYEPVWSIGVNGIPATAEYAEDVHKEIKDILYNLFGEDSKNIPVLYGGSVNPQNASDLIVKPSIDGLFVGRSAWQADKFNDLIRQSLDAYKSI